MAQAVTNHDLEALLAAAEYAHAAFTRQINLAVAGDGSYDSASVYWWLRGRRPEPAVQATIATVLSRRLRRTVSVTELGFDHDTTASLTYPADLDGAITTATGLWALIVRRRDALAATPFVTSAAVQAALAWRYDPADTDRSRPGPHGTVTAADVDALHLYAEQFSHLDRRHGGGALHTRNLLADFLHRQVTPILHGTYTDAVGIRLMGAAARLTGQLGYMAYDAGEHGASQRHLTAALRLSKAADDRLYGAHLLANLATQAIYLGHHREAVRLAAAAIDGAGRAPATVRARLYTTAACAHAVTGNQAACTQALRRARTAIERSTPGDGPDWAGYFSPAHFAGTAVRCYRDLHLPTQALEHGPAALALPADSSRTHALHTALLATAHADRRNLDEACAYGDRAVTHAAAVQSRRVHQRLTELALRLHPHRGVPVVAAFFDRHRDVLAAT